MIKIYIKTYGCAHNISDSEVMAGLLQKAGFEITNNEEDANLIIINSCAVKGQSQKNFFSYLEEKINKIPLVIAGCIPQSIPESIHDISMIGPHQISNIVEIVEETINDHQVTLLVNEDLPRLNLPKVRVNPIVEIIPISKGCLGACTYCLTKKARGNLKSYLPGEIIKQAESAVKEGIKEIWITSQDCGCYGFDIKTNLPSLIQKLVEIEGDFKIRIGMSNPNHILKFTDKLIKILKHPKVFKFLHIPVQSGNNVVLRNMARQYTREEFIDLINNIRKEIPEVTIATDIIAGFPGETDHQHKQTCELLKETMPDVVNISRFSPRPHTVAKSMPDQIVDRIKKERSRELTSVYQWCAFERNNFWKSWSGEVVISEKGKDDSWVARNESYKPIIIKGKYELGQKLNVKIIDRTSFDLRAIVV